MEEERKIKRERKGEERKKLCDKLKRGEGEKLSGKLVYHISVSVCC